MEIEEKLIVEEYEFVFENVTKIIFWITKEEVEYLYCPLFFSIFYISPGHCPLLWNFHNMSVSLQNIIQKIKSGTTVVELKGLSGSSKALVLSMLSSQSTWFEERTKPLIVVCESFDIAEVLLNDLYFFR